MLQGSDIIANLTQIVRASFDMRTGLICQQISERGLPTEPRPDAFTPQTESQPAHSDIEVIELPRNAWPQTLDESQPTAFPDDIDQSPPPEWEARQWDQSAEIWQDTPLAQWATQQGTWDGIDPIPSEEGPVFIYD